MTESAKEFKLPLFPVILAVTLVSFLAAAALQLWSTSKIAEQTIDNEIRNLTKQTHTSLQLFFDNQLGRADLLIGHFANDLQLTQSVVNQNAESAADSLDRLYNSDTGSNLELLFLLVEGNRIWVDSSSPFFSNPQGLQALPLAGMSYGRWYLFQLSVANSSQVIVLRKEPVIDPDSGRISGGLVGGLVLSGKLQMLNEARNYIGVPGLALRYQNQLLADSTDGALSIGGYFRTLGGGDVDAYGRQEQYVVGSYFLQLGSQPSELEFLTLISSASFQQLKEQYIQQGFNLTLLI